MGVGMGVVMRDFNGDVVRAACQQIGHTWELAVTEAKAIVLGLKLAAQGNIRRLICKNV